MLKVLLDANFLILPFQENVDIVSELDRVLEGRYDLYTLNRTYNEARDVEDGKYRDRVERLVEALDIARVDVEEQGSVDEVLVALAGEYVVCTNDRAVRAELRESGLPHVYLRQRSHLVAENVDTALPF